MEHKPIQHFDISNHQFEILVIFFIKKRKLKLSKIRKDKTCGS